MGFWGFEQNPRSEFHLIIVMVENPFFHCIRYCMCGNWFKNSKYFPLLLGEGLSIYCTILKLKKNFLGCMIFSLKSCKCLYYKSYESLYS